MENKFFNLEVATSTLNLTALEFDRIEDLHQECLTSLSAWSESSEIPINLSLVIFPSLSLTGVGGQDAFLRPSVLERSFDSLLRFEDSIPENTVATVGLPLAFKGNLYQALAFIADGKIRGLVCAQFDSLSRRDDLRQFSPWESGKVEYLKVGERRLPIGDLAFKEKGVLFAFRSIFSATNAVNETLDPFFRPKELDDRLLYSNEDEPVSDGGVAIPERLTSTIVEEGCVTDSALTSWNDCDCVLIPGAVPFAMGRQEKIRRALSYLSDRDDNLIIYSNLVGVESGGYVYDGGSMLAFHGICSQNFRFTYGDASLLLENFQLTFSDRGKRRRFTLLQTDSDDVDETSLESWETNVDVKFEEFARATSFGIFDYMRKSFSKGLTLSMSGGADSATIATLIRLGVTIACRQVGALEFLRWIARVDDDEEFAQRFPFLAEVVRNASLLEEKTDISEDEEERLEAEIVSVLLTTVYQATRNSGDVTRRAAKEVAEACGALHYEFNVDSVVENYKSMVAEATNSPFTWEKDDLALQNIQARGRGPSVWLLANRSGRLLLSTGNRSEVACGYATMDGDTCGGLSPISGVDKAFVREWLKWMEKVGIFLSIDENGTIRRFKLPVLRLINEQQPTAELRPAEAKQTDEADLMPYVVLNMFERALIRDRLSLRNAISCVEHDLKEMNFDVDQNQIQNWAIRFCKLWSASQWKRQRYAPGFLLDDYDLSPNSWTRFPILSGGFRFEIDELD